MLVSRWSSEVKLTPKLGIIFFHSPELYLYLNRSTPFTIGLDREKSTVEMYSNSPTPGINIFDL